MPTQAELDILNQQSRARQRRTRSRNDAEDLFEQFQDDGFRGNDNITEDQIFLNNLIEAYLEDGELDQFEIDSLTDSGIDDDLLNRLLSEFSEPLASDEVPVEEVAVLEDDVILEDDVMSPEAIAGLGLGATGFAAQTGRVPSRVRGGRPTPLMQRIRANDLARVTRPTSLVTSPGTRVVPTGGGVPSATRPTGFPRPIINVTGSARQLSLPGRVAGIGSRFFTPLGALATGYGVGSLLDNTFGISDAIGDFFIPEATSGLPAFDPSELTALPSRPIDPPRATFTTDDGIIMERESGQREFITPEELAEFEDLMAQVGQPSVVGFGQGGDMGVDASGFSRTMGIQDTLNELGGMTLNEYLDRPEVTESESEYEKASRERQQRIEDRPDFFSTISDTERRFGETEAPVDLYEQIAESKGLRGKAKQDYIAEEIRLFNRAEKTRDLQDQRLEEMIKNYTRPATNVVQKAITKVDNQIANGLAKPSERTYLILVELRGKKAVDDMIEAGLNVEKDFSVYLGGGNLDPTLELMQDLDQTKMTFKDGMAYDYVNDNYNSDDPSIQSRVAAMRDNLIKTYGDSKSSRRSN